ncbi:hypothetical protein M422DRAFT_274629 [Sphaerobolus stellatus SS14]|uniref:DUF6532 domain-containing protein n=1 Tax=Sphaerobolus stellatus (strain SS14) TaxID=990650 RepID=A0A0C9U618_SPHS4|nr:hypothetical protein M422DRAFT_274629 [Sphaerobolus stellatus SS14]
MFGRKFIQEILDHFIFNLNARPALGARFEGTFDPTTLLTVALACTLAHYVLKNLIRNKKRGGEFSGDAYAPISVQDLKMLEDFEEEFSDGYPPGSVPFHVVQKWYLGKIVARRYMVTRLLHVR